MTEKDNKFNLQSPQGDNSSSTSLDSSAAANAASEVKTHGHIKSFVMRAGRLTDGQERAIEEYFPLYGLEFPGVGKELKLNFPKEQDLVLEIGFGMGTSLVEMAEANPHLNYLGVEVHTPGVGNCLKLTAAKGLTNLRVIQHDAFEVLDCLAEGSLAGLQLFFPDPWHKKRHHKRRIVKAEFMAKVLRAMKSGGFIHMATDWENYAEHMLEVLNATPGIHNTAEKDYIPRPDSRPLTKFEQRGERLGHGVWDLYFIKD